MTSYRGCDTDDAPHTQVHQDDPSTPEKHPVGGRRRVAKLGAAERQAASERWRQVEEELVGLTQCAACCTLVVALTGGPALLLLAWLTQIDRGYWVGCGFRIPDSGPVIIARAEFALGQNPAEAAAG